MRPLWSSQIHWVSITEIPWPAMDATVQTYIAGCELCRRIEAPRCAHHGTNMLLPPLSRPWEQVSMDFITHLAESTASGYPGILLIVDRLTNTAIYLPCRKDIDPPGLAQMFFEHVICKRGVLENIVTNCGKEFTSRFWNRVCSHLSINHRLSTAFHPQTDGQMEWQNQTMEQSLRAFANYEQDHWVALLPLAEFAYNNSVHHSTRMMPFWANYHNHPPMQFKPPKAPSNMRSEKLADAKISGIEETHQLLRESLLEARARQSEYAGGMGVAFAVGNNVWLSTRHFQTTGQCMVSKIVNLCAYKLDLPKTMRNHKVIHVSHLDHYTPPVVGQPSSEPYPGIVDDSEEWEVEQILDSKQHYQTQHYLMQWVWYNHICASWEPLEDVENARELINEFHQDHLDKLPRLSKSDLRSGGIDGMEIWRLRSFGHFLLSISLCWDPVQYKWRGYRFDHLQKSSQLEVEFHVHWNVTLDRTTQSAELWNHMSVYAGCFPCFTCT